MDAPMLEQNTSNPSFIILLERIQRVIPQIMFIWIFLTYIVTAVISIYSIPLPLWLKIPISIIIQGSRFLTVFINFLHKQSQSFRMNKFIHNHKYNKKPPLYQ